jgi:hypothetical protein
MPTSLTPYLILVFLVLPGVAAVSALEDASSPREVIELEVADDDGDLSSEALSIIDEAEALLQGADQSQGQGTAHSGVGPEPEAGSFLVAPELSPHKIRQQELRRQTAGIDWNGQISSDTSDAEAASGHGSGGGEVDSSDGSAALLADDREVDTGGFAVGSMAAVNPLSEFIFADTDEWVVWPGLRKEISLKFDCVVLVQYQTSSFVYNTHLMSRLMIDDQPMPGSTSAVGNTLYGTTFGFFVDWLSAGKHVIHAEYRTGSGYLDDLVKENRFAHAGDDWQTRSLNVLVLPEAELSIARPQWKFRLQPTNHWHTWQGFDLETNLTEETPVLALDTAVCSGKNKFLASKMYIDGHEKKQTRSVAGGTAYAQNTGFWAGNVPAVFTIGP